MEKPNPYRPRLTKNEQEVLKNIIFAAKTPDTDIAKKMKLSQQAVFKMRNKLEQSGIIEGYMPIINYKKLGINIMVFLAIKVTSPVWEKFSEHEVDGKLKSIPYITNVYRIPDSNFTHLLLLGFKNIEQKDKFLMKFQTAYSDEIEIIHIYPFSVDRIISQNPMSLLYEIIDDKDFKLSTLFREKKQ